APGVFRKSFDSLIKKMVHPEVWLYWRDTSRGKGHNALDAPELESEIDPVKRDNIMYSAYLQVMTLLYHVLFNDSKYSDKNSIEFKFEPLMCLYNRHVTYGYDENSLNDTIYWNMVQSGYLGVACEPHCIFQICNQVPILGFRLHDWLTGGSVAEEVTEGYQKAWADFGGPLGDDGHYTTTIMSHTMQPVQGAIWGPWSDSWCSMLRNAWDSDFVRRNYERQRDSWLVPGGDGAISVKVNPSPPGMDIPLGAWGDFGWVIGCVSEMGDAEVLQGLLTHADRYMNPRWDKGGYFYPRNDVGRDDEGNLTAMSPTIGNAMIQYARLNVEDGLRKLYEEPWEAGHYEQPAVLEISDFADVSRAIFLPEQEALVVSLRPFDGREEPIDLEVGNVEQRGHWRLELDGREVASGRGSHCDKSDPVVAVRPTESGAIGIRLNASHHPTLVMRWDVA
ncbi:MAG: hypothetical protein RLP45_03210, partial [Haliea sp.]